MKNQVITDTITVWCFALTHGIIDFVSALVVYNAAIVHNLPPSKAVAFIIAYDLIAFALQPFAGLIIDHVKGARPGMLIGTTLALTGVILMRVDAISGIVSVGIGNALFHLGAGAQILGRYPKTTSAIGIFVGPGALGLSIGFWLGNKGFFPLTYLAIGLVAVCIGLAILPKFKTISFLAMNAPHQVIPRPCVVILLLAAIAIRGFIGRTGFIGLESDAFVIIGLGAAACIGKMAGGVLADRFGWGRTAIGALLLSGIGIVFVRSGIWLAFSTMILFQMTMPITLSATAMALPGKPAFAFGLTCLALICGTLSAFYAPQVLKQLSFTLEMIGVSGVCIVSALWRLGYMKLQNK